MGGASPSKLACAAARGDVAAVEAIVDRGGVDPNTRASVPRDLLPRLIRASSGVAAAAAPPAEKRRRTREREASASATLGPAAVRALAAIAAARPRRVRRGSAPLPDVSLSSAAPSFAPPSSAAEWAPLQVAAAAGHIEACAALLARGAAVNVGEHEPAEGGRGTTPLHLAVRGRHAGVAELLLSQPGVHPSPGHCPDAGAGGPGYRTPLHEAAAAVSAALCRLLLARGASPWADPVGRAPEAAAPAATAPPLPPPGTPLDEARAAVARAASRGGGGAAINLGAVAVLEAAQQKAPKPPSRLAYEREREARREWWASPESAALRLCGAARRGDLAAVRAALEGGASPDCAARLEGVAGSSPALFYAADAGHEDVCRALLLAGASARAVNDRGSTALHVAARAGSAAVCALLLRHGADPAAATAGGGRTAAELAEARGHSGAASVLRSFGAASRA